MLVYFQMFYIYRFCYRVSFLKSIVFIVLTLTHLIGSNKIFKITQKFQLNMNFQ